MWERRKICGQQIIGIKDAKLRLYSNFSFISISLAYFSSQSPLERNLKNKLHLIKCSFTRKRKTIFCCQSLLLNPIYSVSADDENELLNRFTNQRSVLPSIFLCTPCELRPLVETAEPSQEDINHRYKLASCWTKMAPTLPIIARMKLIASAALDTYKANLWKKNFDFMVNNK